MDIKPDFHILIFGVCDEKARMIVCEYTISKPKTIFYKGEEVFAGIYKVPTTKPRMVRLLNIDGDEQADLTVHGGVDKAVSDFRLNIIRTIRKS